MVSYIERWHAGVSVVRRGDPTAVGSLAEHMLQILFPQRRIRPWARCYALCPRENVRIDRRHRNNEFSRAEMSWPPLAVAPGAMEWNENCQEEGDVVMHPARKKSLRVGLLVKTLMKGRAGQEGAPDSMPTRTIAAAQTEIDVAAKVQN